MKNKKRFIIGMVLILLIFSMGIFLQKSINRNVKLNKDDVMSLTEAEQIEVGKNSKITSAVITQRKTGTGPWDDNDDAGNDTSADNDIVRSFDQVTYTVEYTMGLKDGASVENYKGGVIEVKAELPETCANVVKWDTDSMAWMEDANISDDGTTITGKYTLASTEITVPGKQTLVFVLKVLGAPNKLEVQPTFTSNLLGNDESEEVSIQDSVVTVSAVSNYNLRIERNSSVANKTTVNYGNGDTLGRMYGYGIALELYNQSQDKGLKGIEYPNGDITFDVNLKLERSGFETTELEDITDKCTPVLWNYSINNPVPIPLIKDRQMWTKGNILDLCLYAFPLGGGENDRTYCVKNAGNWEMTQNGKTISVNVNNYEFDGTFPMYYWGYYGKIRSTPDFNENEGIFSVGYFQIFVPDNEESTIEDRNYYLTVSDNNMLATSNSGVTTQVQAKTDDDETRAQHVIHKPGRYSHCIEFRTLSNNKVESNWGNGDASAVIDSEFLLGSKFSISLSNDYDVYGASKFIKFDGDAVEPELMESGDKYKTLAFGGTMKFKVWYVTKSDGTNWTSQTDMNNGNIEDMNLYENIEDIPEGYVCIGEFFESTGGYLSVASGDNNIVCVKMKVKDTANIGQTYGFTCRTKIWKDELDRSIYTVTNKDVTYPQVEWDSGNLQYVKTEYDNNGVMISGTHNGGSIYGNTILVTAATLNITSKAIDESGNTKVNYDLGKNEYDVTYQLQSSLSNANLKTSITGVNLKIEETLPAGMTYVPGSCEYDEPEITQNNDGTTLLVWYKYNCTVGEEIEPIVYKAHISEETTNGMQYQTKTTVKEIVGDGEAYKVGNSRIDARTYTTAINVINLSNYSVYKTTTTPMIELNGQIHYKVTFLNKTEDTVNDFQMLDILPYSGDSRGSSFAGTYTVEKIDLKQTKSDETIANDNLKLYVTNSESVRTGVTVKDEDLGTSSIWIQATSGQAINQENTAYAITGPIAGKTRLEVDVYLKTTGNKAEDVYKNTATVQTNKSTEAMQTSIITVQDIKRELSGKVWFDSNADGLMNNNEQMIEGAKLKLVNEDGSTAIDIDGNEIQPVLTDKNGYYEFENMVKGNYKVQVEVTDDEKEITLKGVGVNREINSNFNSDGSTDVITELNSAESPVLSEKNVNAGIKYKNTTVLVHHYIKGTTTKLSEDVTVNGKIYDEYTTSKASDIPEQYELVETPTNAIGTMTKNQIVVTYYYQLKNYPYTVNYLEKDTNKVLHTAKQGDELIYGSTVTSSNEVIDIDGYNYDSVDKDTLTIGIRDNVINIYYTKVIGLSYTVNYLEKDTNEVIHEPKTTDNMTFEDEITSSNEVIEIDGYDYDSVDKEKLVIGTKENVINIYYTKRIDLEYEVNFLEKGTNKVLSKMKVKKGMKFKDIVKSSDEIIEIDGYNFSDVDKDILEILTSGNVINIYYTKREDVSYKVNYLEKETNKVLHEQKVQENMTFESVIKSSDEVIDIYGYNYDSADNESITLTTGENVINLYYTKKDTKVTVHYYEEGTTNKVSNDVEILGKVFDNYETESASDIPSKYELVAEPENKNGTMTEDEITVIYYYRKKATKVIVHYYEENTTKKLSEDVTINGRVDDKYTTISATDIPIKYELVATPSNASGSMTEATVEVIYYYRVKDAVVHVRYLEKGTNKVLADPDRLDGKVDDDYQTKAKEIDGYQLVEHTGNEKGKFEVEPLTITYYYLYKTKATVQYIDKMTGKILEQSTTEGLEGDDFVTESKDFENYVLVEEPAEKTVKMTKKEQVLKYYYIHVSGGVIEKHIDVISGQILANKTYEGNEGDAYDIPSRTFEGYDLVEDRLPANSKGTMKVEPVEVIYYYIYRSKVTAEYIDKNTGSKLTKDETQTGYEGDNYITDRKIFDDYKLVAVPENADGSMTKEDITVTYYYVHTSGGVIVNHIDIKTGKQLLNETKEEGYEGDPYETHEESIPEYDLVKEKYPENAVGKMTIEPTRVTYYYIKKTEVNIKYVDKETGEEIDEPTNIPGHEGDDYTTESKDVPGYDLIEEPENKDGTMTADPIDVIYYYKRPAKVIVNYYDIDTKEKLADEIEITGHQNDDYTTEQKDIKYYEIAKIPENKEGKMIVTVTKDENGKEIVDDTTYVNYYYRKLIFNLRVDKTIASVIVNGQETPINGSLGKVEVHRKNISNANIKVVYKIKVTNDSELSGKANVVEKIPNGMTMLPENNSDWIIKETTASLETDEIKPGESREYQVVLGWQNGDGNVGTKENIASIITENEAGFDEKDTTDNESKADLIVAVGTGEVPYVAIAGGILLIMIAITSGIYVIRKKRQ